MDAVMTDDMLHAAATADNSQASASSSPSVSPLSSASPRPEKTISTEFEKNVAPSPTPEATPAAQPSPTSAPSPAPSNPSPTPQKVIQHSPTPAPTQRTVTPKASQSGRGKAGSGHATPSPSVAPPRKGISSGAAPGYRTPAGLTPRKAQPHETRGIPGTAAGVEGAPFPLDSDASPISMLYATRARMKIQSNFTVPPTVNDPDLTCVVEWEILPDGTITNIRIVKSTGNAALDACAINALRKTRSLGPLPPEWGNRSVWTSLTFVFAGNTPQH